MISLPIDKLKSHCIRSKDSYFKEHAKETVNIDGERYIYIDNRSSILAVAHLDTVFNSRDYVKYKTCGETFIFSPSLDDRLGVYTILEVLPLLNIKVDILLTENEESGLSTAFNFTSSKEYKWMIEFDRRELEPVLYDYETTEILTALKTIGLTPSIGSYSDIRELTALGVCGINWGVGYIAEHTKLCRVSVNDYLKTIERFWRFYKRYKDTKFKHDLATSAIYRETDYLDDRDYYARDYLPLKKTRRSKSKICGYCQDDINTIYYEEYQSWLCDNCVNYWDSLADTKTVRRIIDG